MECRGKKFELSFVISKDLLCISTLVYMIREYLLRKTGQRVESFEEFVVLNLLSLV